MKPQAICRGCKQELCFESLSWPAMSRSLDNQLEVIRTYNTQHRKRSMNTDVGDHDNLNLASLIGDRWTLLILISAFLGVQRYDGFLTQLYIPPSVLSERLKQLVTNGIFNKTEYQQKPIRHNYILNPKGKALFPFVMTLRQWVVENQGLSNNPIKHADCGKALFIDIVCDQCGHKPWPDELELIAHSETKARLSKSSGQS